MASKAVQKILEWAKENRANQPSLGGELKAMGREFLHEARTTLNEVFFSKAENPSEPGTPMSPTQYQINQDLEVEKGIDMEM